MKLPLEALKEESSALIPKDTAETEIVRIDNTKPLAAYGTYNDLEYLEEDTKARIKFTRYLEKQARGSFELRNYISFLKENMDLTKCRILNGVDSTGASIELHHFPFSLFDIAQIILNDAMTNKENISSFSLVGRIVEEHYAGHIGFIPLSETAHELAHAGKIALSLTAVYGDWKAFAKKYWKSLSEEQISALKFLVKTSATSESQEANFRKLHVKKRIIELPESSGS